MNPQQNFTKDISLFKSFFIGGFECSCHRIGSGKRLDLLASTQHDKYVVKDYLRLQKLGISTARSGIRWHLIETSPGYYDFSTVLPMLQAARETGMQVIWDLCHYGWPDDIDIFSSEFIRRFNGFVTAFARLLANETDTIPLLCPMNEISFFSWAGGDKGYINPFQHERGHDLKRQLVLATVEATEAVWNILPQARMVQAEPAINIIPAPDRPEDQAMVEAYRLAQYQAWDMLCGRLEPQLGGQEKYLDIIGINYYAINQWIHEGITLNHRHPLYKPFRNILQEIYERYGRPMFVAETGTEGEARGDWLSYIGSEVRAAIEAGLPVHGICLYPILNHLGWDNDRYCPNGLWDDPDENGERKICEPLAHELRRQQRLLVQVETKVQYRRMDNKSNESRFYTKKTKPVICLFTDSHEPSGMGEHMLTLATELLRQYHILFVCPPTTTGQRFLERATAAGCMALALDVRGRGADWDHLCYWLRTLPVDVFHSHAGIGWEGHDGTYAAREAGVPVVLRTEHLPYLITDHHQRVAHQALMGAVDQLICVSEEARKSFLRAGVSVEKLSVVRNGILPPVLRSKKQAIRTELELPPTAKIVLTVARMTEQKGHCYLLEAIPRIIEQEPEAHFVWVGDGPLETQLRQQVTAQALEQHVHFIGRRNDVPALLSSANLFVLPSLFEGLPLVVLEAMAMGVPVVGTRVCGTSEAVLDGINGRLVAPRDSAELAAAILEGLEQPQIAARWRNNGRQRFQQEFSATRMAQEMTAIYERLRYEKEAAPIRAAIGMAA